MYWQPSKPLWEREMETEFARISGWKRVPKKPGSARRRKKVKRA